MSEYTVLRKLGLSKTAVACYERLFNDGAASVAQLAGRLDRPRTGLYRVLKELETKGFVTSLKTISQPMYFFARPVDKALRSYGSYQRQLANQLAIEQNEILMKRSGK